MYDKKGMYAAVCCLVIGVVYSKEENGVKQNDMRLL